MEKLSVLFVFIFTLLTPFAFGQNDGPQETAKSRYLNGKVKSLTTITYNISISYDKKLVEKELFGYRNTFYKDGFIDSTFSRNYLTDYVFQMDYHYFWNGDTLTSTVHKQNAWGKTVFDKNQLPIYSYFFFEKAILPVSERWFEYDKQGRLTTIKSKMQGMDARVDYTYQKNGNNFKVNVSDKPGMDYYEVNSSLKKTIDVSYSNYGGDEVKSEVKYFYDVQGNVIREERKSYKKAGKNWVLLDGGGKTEFQYVYDSQNNWIEKTSLYNGEPSEVVRRTIVYW